MSGLACIDASVAAKWLLPEQDSDLALGLYSHLRDSGTTMIAPPHMAVEVVNVIHTRVVRKLITPDEADDLLDLFLDFGVQLAMPDGLYAAATQLARRFDRPTVYDTHYVALAQLAGCDLWTADLKLVNGLRGRLPFVKPLHAFTSLPYR